MVLHFHSHDGAGEGTCLSVFGSLWGQQIRWQGGVEGVREEDKLELDLQWAVTFIIPWEASFLALRGLGPVLHHKLPKLPD